MKITKVISVLLIAAMMTAVSGCGTTTANYPMKPNVAPKEFATKAGSENGIYWRNSISVPNESPYWATKAALGVGGSTNSKTKAVIPPELIAAAVSVVAETGTKLSQYQKDIRNANVAGSQEFMAWGFDSPEQLQALFPIIQALGAASETP